MHAHGIHDLSSAYGRPVRHVYSDGVFGPVDVSGNGMGESTNRFNDRMWVVSSWRLSCFTYYFLSVLFQVFLPCLCAAGFSGYALDPRVVPGPSVGHECFQHSSLPRNGCDGGQPWFSYAGHQSFLGIAKYPSIFGSTFSAPTCAVPMDIGSGSFPYGQCIAYWMCVWICVVCFVCVHWIYFLLGFYLLVSMVLCWSLFRYRSCFVCMMLCTSFFLCR